MADPAMADPAAPADTPEAAILSLVRARGPDKSICPSEAARRLAAMQGTDAAWRALLSPIRRAGARLAAEGQIDILRKGRPVAADAIRGVVRFRLRLERPEQEQGRG